MFSEFNRYLNPYQYGSKVTLEIQDPSLEMHYKVNSQYFLIGLEKRETDVGHLEFKSAQHCLVMPPVTHSSNLSSLLYLMISSSFPMKLLF